jgi:hypothetical protein
MILASLTASATVGQNGCDFNIVGTWKAGTGGETSTLLYRFAQDGTVIVLSGFGSGQRLDLKEIARATYQLDYPNAPKAISFTATRKAGVLAEGTTSFHITRYDDASFTSAISVGPGAGTIRWARVEPSRYFVVLAARSGTFYDRSGPTFPMLIRVDGNQAQVDAVGIFSVRNKPAFGPVPAETYREFMREPHNPSDVMLRLEITRAEYDRTSKILRAWDKRAREGDLLYPDVFMDNILLVKQITESLNLCGEKIKLYKLDWGIEDSISENNRPPNIPFKYFKELRRLNESLHVPDDKFPAPRQPDGVFR